MKKEEIAGLGIAGQMHGLVTIDDDDKVIRPCILWNDSRTQKEVDYLNNKIGKDKLTDLVGNIAFAGFTAPKILWMRANEPELFGRIKKIMLPKDYLNYKLTGVCSCDYSDASGMLLLDVKNRRWSDEMVGICHITRDQLPGLYESSDVIGCIKDEVADALGLPHGVKVVAGAGDNAGAAIGMGVTGEGKCNISLGTSGTIFVSADHYSVDNNNGLHSFAHADGMYHLMGCMLSAASCNKWFCSDILGNDDYSGLQAGISDDKLGKNKVFFLPYLMGERSPINDVNTRGTFIGMSMDTSKEDMVLAVLEGVAFGIRDSFEIVKKLGIDVKGSMICGGGAKSPLWRKIISNVLGIPLFINKADSGPSNGAAILAMVGCGEYGSAAEAAAAIVHTETAETPDRDLVDLYEERYMEFSKLYPSLKKSFYEIYAQ